ncbi:cysteine--tRNA ligase [Candidatus Woesebacteria bacterium CG22_combo_CG10-13_8_21_14_all_39_10]|uniref:Cysteine--tRNA ligase n=3 Tax=Patescibacteria group TaxID=1783273 RepID=A0A2H0BIS3_9BACT|nr:MAG: cysteine--tRNA ligase [Candidatus Woesebacteria bacterium CG22_combo_CG10-13_8_21_14_all_39_10]PIZ48430.1 MAG: cysteine--tRNA ligase [Candidatus Woesebacteria bacterium CG_4_10_14_0_2_um_filter_39_14]
MSIETYNTLSRRTEEFKPIEEGKVNFFVCGPTVYDYAHIGNAKTYTQFDFIVKYLRYRDYNVFYLQNITDIDDKIIKRAQKKGVSWKELADQYTQIFMEDMRSLGNDAVTEYARAIDYIPQIVEQVRTLEDKGFAYRTSDGIYFEISKFDEYGKLSRRTEVQETDGVSRIDASPEKRGWNDFCLWKFSKPGEPSWETEIGAGRPGWHIEDTAITETFFGPQYDAHGGAVDLIFPHHEAEIAQMEAASGKSPLVRYWFHTGFLNMKDKKMSKSLGNFLTIRETIQKSDARILRFLFLSGHYRSSMDFNDEVLDQAKRSLKRIDEFIFGLDESHEVAGEEHLVENLRQEVISHLDSDFNTPRALSAIFDYIKERNQDGLAGKHTLKYFKEINAFFGFLDLAKELNDEEIERLVKLRDDYRKRKEYEKADEVKQTLIEKGIQLYDFNNETKWRRPKV